MTADNNNGEPYFYRNVMAKIDSLPASKTLNYRANELKTHMYRGQKKHDFLDFLSNRYETQVNNNIAGHFVRNKERDIAIIALMLGAGVRVQEAASANVKELNIQAHAKCDPQRRSKRYCANCTLGIALYQKVLGRQK